MEPISRDALLLSSEYYSMPPDRLENDQLHPLK